MASTDFCKDVWVMKGVWVERNSKLTNGWNEMDEWMDRWIRCLGKRQQQQQEIVVDVKVQTIFFLFLLYISFV